MSIRHSQFVHLSSPLFILLLLLALILPASSPADDAPSLRLPLPKPGLYIPVPAGIGADTHQFILDTGCGRPVLDHSLRHLAGAPVSRSNVHSAAGQRLSAALHEFPPSRSAPSSWKKEPAPSSTAII